MIDTVGHLADANETRLADANETRLVSSVNKVQRDQLLFGFFV